MITWNPQRVHELVNSLAERKKRLAALITQASFEGCGYMHTPTAYDAYERLDALEELVLMMLSRGEGSVPEENS